MFTCLTHNVAISQKSILSIHALIQFITMSPGETVFKGFHANSELGKTGFCYYAPY